jgi:hypothetical protein
MKITTNITEEGNYKTKAYAANTLAMGRRAGVRFMAASPLHLDRRWNKPSARSKANRDPLSENNATGT